MGCVRAKSSRAPHPDEYKLLASGHAGADGGEGGVFRLADFPIPEDVRDSKIHYRIVRERDHSSLVPQVCAAVGGLEKIVVECTHCPSRVNSAGKTMRHRIVSVYAQGDGRYRLVAIRRRDEQKEVEEDDDSSLGSLVMRTFLERAKTQGLDVAGVPLIGLDPELADPSDRLLLNQEGIPYALKIEEGEIFNHVRWRLSSAPDAVQPLGAKTIIGLQWPERDLDADTPSPPVPIFDLLLESGRTRKRLPECLIEVPVAGGDADFFLVGGPVATDSEGLAKVTQMQELAVEASARARDPLSRDLRMHEFDYPDDEGFSTILIAVDYGRGL